MDKLMTVATTYHQVIEKWVKHFIDTMFKDLDTLTVGDDGGETPYGIKIIFDGYGEDIEGNEDKNKLSFAVFVHKDSLTKKFKEHETNPLAIIHRPSEECCVICWYFKEENELDVITMIEDDPNCTELERKFVIDLILKIELRDG